MGRGKLYSWGPNHAADLILTRLSKEGKGQGRELLAIRRRDTGEWAVIGGFINQGERPEEAATREFGEEALGIAEDEGEEEGGGGGGGGGGGAQAKGEKEGSGERARALLSQLCPPSALRCVYRGYVDDARNTDGAWIETAAFAVDLPEHLHNDEVDRLLVGGSDASEVRWIPIRSANGHAEFEHLYASHKQMVLHAMHITQPTSRWPE